MVARFVASQGLRPNSLYKLPVEDEGQGQEGTSLQEEGEGAGGSVKVLERLQCETLFLFCLFFHISLSLMSYVQPANAVKVLKLLGSGY